LPPIGLLKLLDVILILLISWVFDFNFLVRFKTWDVISWGWPAGVLRDNHDLSDLSEGILFNDPALESIHQLLLSFWSD
jgi:hypothetical protein